MRDHTRRLMRCVVSAAALTLALSGCGSNEQPEYDYGPVSQGPSDAASTTSSEPAATEQTCEDIWVEGAVLPDGYDGCANASGQLQAYLDYGDCTDGRKFVGYSPHDGPHYYAGLGGVIAQGGVDDDHWYVALAECTGE